MALVEDASGLPVPVQYAFIPLVMLTAGLVEHLPTEKHTPHRRHSVYICASQVKRIPDIGVSGRSRRIVSKASSALVPGRKTSPTFPQPDVT